MNFFGWIQFVPYYHLGARGGYSIKISIEVPNFLPKLHTTVNLHAYFLLDCANYLFPYSKYSSLSIIYWVFVVAIPIRILFPSVPYILLDLCVLCWLEDYIWFVFLDWVWFTFKLRKNLRVLKGSDCEHNIGYKPIECKHEWSDITRV